MMVFNKGATVARVWLDEAPYSGGVVLDQSVDLRVRNRTVRCSPEVVAMEILVAAGPIAPYGLLGVEARDCDSGSDVLRLHFPASTGGAFPDSLGVGMDRVTIGLPEEFQSAVFDAVATRASTLDGGRELSFSWAATGDYGSSPNLFRLLTNALLDVLETPLELRTEGFLREIFDRVRSLRLPW